MKVQALPFATNSAGALSLERADKKKFGWSNALRFFWKKSRIKYVNIFIDVREESIE